MALFKKRSKINIGNMFVPGSRYSWLSPNNATAFSCINLIASAIAGMPINLYRNEKEGRVKEINHPLHSLLHNEPNADETVTMFKTRMVFDYFEKGNVYIYQNKDQWGVINSLFLLDPTKMTVTRDAYNQKVFTYNNRQSYTYKEVLHIPSRFGYDGLTGKSIYTYANEVFERAGKLDTYVDASFQNSLGKRLVLDLSEIGTEITKEQEEAIVNAYITKYQGIQNTSRPIVKKIRGLNYSNIDSGTADNRAAQLIENRDFQDREIAKMFGIPLSFLSGENKYGDIESLFMMFIETGVKPVADIIEDSLNKLLYPNERKDLYFEFSYNSLLKTNLTAKIDAYTKQLGKAILSIDEVREKENLAPLPGGVGKVHILDGGNFLPLLPDILDAYMASSKEKIKKLANGDDSVGIGSDKK